MDKLEYIPGDMVMTNGVPLGTAQNVVYRVTSSDPSKTLKLDDGTVLKGVVCLENIEGAEFGEKGYLSSDCCAWVKDIVPINLVPAILEKNGWKRIFREHLGGDNVSIFWFNNNIGDCAEFEEFYGYFSPKIFKIPIIHYVHRLQHYFFGLGLKIKIEV